MNVLGIALFALVLAVIEAMANYMVKGSADDVAEELRPSLRECAWLAIESDQAGRRIFHLVDT